MALLISLLFLFAISVSANIVGDVPLKYNYVCDPVRFADIGLDMSEFAYCDKSLPYDVRAKDLVARMKLSEKAQQMGDNSTGVMRIGLPAYEWWSEALHGVSKTGPGTFFGDSVPGATSFPTVILTTASFNRTLWKTIGQVVSTEARAMYNLGQAGLTFWSPNINVIRDPRWGRTSETPGEDPFVVGTYASTYVRALQDVEGADYTADPNFRPLKVSACCKHYTAYDLDSWFGVDRFHFDARVTEQDMAETFQPPFEMCVREGDASSVMCSFNRVNGIPTCTDPRLLKQTVRGKWDLHGYIVADCDSIEVIVNKHKWLGDTPEDAVSQALKAGLDLDCGHFYPNALENAVYQGQISESEIDESLKNLYVLLMRVGFFDGRPKYASLTKQDICSHNNIKLAEEAAKQGVVLLKNNNTLPLSSSQYKKLALVGPHANATLAMIGNYAGIPCRYISPLQGFSAYSDVTYKMGCGETLCRNDTLIFPAVQAARNADATIVIAGLDLSVENENVDRVDLLLPGYQNQLITQVANAAKGPVILVIMCAGGVDISFAKNHPNIKAIIWAGYPGQEGGRAIADIVFGKYNPGGRLPLTWYEADYANQLPMTSLKLRPVDSLGYPGRTYKFFNGSTVYPFGYGLSYTQFKYQTASSGKIIPIDIKLGKHQLCRHVNYTDATSLPQENPCPAALVEDLECKEKVKFKVAVQNTGKRDGSEVVMVYSKPPAGLEGTHQKQVVGFERVSVAAGKQEEAEFELDVCRSLAIVDAVGYKLLPSGVHTVLVGDDDKGGAIQVKISYYH